MPLPSPIVSLLEASVAVLADRHRSHEAERPIDASRMDENLVVSEMQHYQNSTSSAVQAKLNIRTEADFWSAFRSCAKAAGGCLGEKR